MYGVSVRKHNSRYLKEEHLIAGSRSWLFCRESLDLEIGINSSLIKNPFTNLEVCLIKNFCLDSQVELETARYADLDEVVYDVECVLKQQLPGCQVLKFGSCSSQVAFKNSDVDLFLQCGELSLSLYLKDKISLIIYCIYKLFDHLLYLQPFTHIYFVQSNLNKTNLKGSGKNSSYRSICSKDVRFSKVFSTAFCLIEVSHSSGITIYLNKGFCGQPL